MNDIHKIYLAAPVVADEDTKRGVDSIHKALYKWSFKAQPAPDEQPSGDKLYEIYRPGMHKVPNEWGIPMDVWGQCVFTMDVTAIDSCDWVVLCDFGREARTTGTAWECGYAFAKGKKILIVRMPFTDKRARSLMITGCASNDVFYDDFVGCKSQKEFLSLFVERGRLPQKTDLLN